VLIGAQVKLKAVKALWWRFTHWDFEYISNLEIDHLGDAAAHGFWNIVKLCIAPVRTRRVSDFEPFILQRGSRSILKGWSWWSQVPGSITVKIVLMVQWKNLGLKQSCFDSLFNSFRGFHACTSNTIAGAWLPQRWSKRWSGRLALLRQLWHSVLVRFSGSLLLFLRQQKSALEGDLRTWCILLDGKQNGYKLHRTTQAEKTSKKDSTVQ